jgi:hypothetical protein
MADRRVDITEGSPTPYDVLVEQLDEAKTRIASLQSQVERVNHNHRQAITDLYSTPQKRADMGKRLATFAGKGLRCAAEKANQKPPTTDEIEKYSHERFLASMSMSNSESPACDEELGASLFIDFISAALAITQPAKTTTPYGPIAMMLQYATEYANSKYISESTYALVLITKQKTHCKSLTEMWSGVMPGGQGYDAMRSQQHKSAEAWNVAPHGIPLDHDVSANFDNNAKKYVEVHRANTSLLHGTKGDIVWTTCMAFVVVQLRDSGSSLRQSLRTSTQTNPENNPISWRGLRPLRLSPHAIFYEENSNDVHSSAVFNRPEGTPSDMQFQFMAGTAYFDSAFTEVESQLRHEATYDIPFNQPQESYQQRAKSKVTLDELDADPNGGGGYPHDEVNNAGVHVMTDHFWKNSIEPLLRPKGCGKCGRTYSKCGTVQCVCGTTLPNMDEMRSKMGSKDATSTYREYTVKHRSLLPPKISTLGPSPSISRAHALDGAALQPAIVAAVATESPEFSAENSLSQELFRHYSKTLPVEHTNPGCQLGQAQILTRYAKQLKLLGHGGVPGDCRYFLYKSPDLGADTAGSIAGFEDWFICFVHIMALLHESKMFMELTLEQLDLIGTPPYDNSDTHQLKIIHSAISSCAVRVLTCFGALSNVSLSCAAHQLALYRTTFNSETIQQHWYILKSNAAHRIGYNCSASHHMPAYYSATQRAVR